VLPDASKNMHLTWNVGHEAGILSVIGGGSELLPDSLGNGCSNRHLDAL
jgi:hypothetical protein